MGALDQVGSWPAPEAAVAVFDAEGVRATVGDPARSQRWASVTKLVTALAVLVEVESGTFDLDEPAGPPGATVRHLLAHASGLGFDDDRVVSEPGRRRLYSNAGFDVLGALLAERSGMEISEVLRDS